MQTIKNAVWTGKWCLGVRMTNGLFYPAWRSEVFLFRSAVIKDYDSCLGKGYYEKARRRGRIKAIKLYVEDTRPQARK